DLVAHALLLDAVRRRRQQDLDGLLADSAFKNALPVVAAAKAQNVGEHLVAERSQLRAEPQREGIVLWTGVTDEQRLARRVAHDSVPDSGPSVEDFPINASCKIRPGNCLI